VSTKQTVQRTFKEFEYPGVVIMSPHPDDSALACGGLISRLHQVRPRDVRISILVATTGFRGVDDEDIEEHRLRRQALQGLVQWQELPTEISADETRLLEAVKAKLGAEFSEYGEGDAAAFANLLKASLRFLEVRAEAAALQLDPDRDVRFLAYPGIYRRRIQSRELTDLHRHLVDAASPGGRNLLMVPHPEDPQPAHQVVTEASIRALGTDLEWDIWYYQSPWFTIDPHLVDVVVSLDYADIGMKQNAVSKHTTQIKRSPYVDYAQAQARLLAGVLPEEILGFGSKEMNAFGKYCEIFQKRMPAFYAPGTADQVEILTDVPLNLPEAQNAAT
jgi:LmbE family N-acetylglucosaminyl deacetylase